jgi:peptidoglycan hydrolase CwlO-like protein
MFTTHLGGGMIKLQNLKTKMKKFKLFRRRVTSSALLLVGGVMTFGIISSPLVSADQYSAQIQALQNQNGQIQSTISGLQGQAATYQQQVDQLTAQIAAIQQQEAITENQITNTQAQIQANQVKLTQEKATLDSIIKSMYVNGNLSTLEMLATSNNLSDFVTKEEYQNIVQNQIQSTLATINQTQATLKQQNADLNGQLSRQSAMNGQLSSSESQQQQLLSYNQSQQSQYNQQVQANQGQISSLEAQQAAINRRNSTFITAPASGGSGGSCDRGQGNGGYPLEWCNPSEDSVITSGNFPNRECTSFAFWYFTAVEGNSGFYATGNAKDWIYTSNRPVDQTPADGSIAVHTAGTYGHVMIVVAIPGETYDGSVVPAGYIDTISMNDGYDGMFYAMQRSSAGFYYIH